MIDGGGREREREGNDLKFQSISPLFQNECEQLLMGGSDFWAY